MIPTSAHTSAELGERAGAEPHDAGRSALAHADASALDAGKTSEPAGDRGRPLAGESRERVRDSCLCPSGPPGDRDLAPPVHALDPRLHERAGGELRLDGGTRDERHAVAGEDGAPDGLLQPELEVQVEVAQPEPEPSELVLDDPADAGALLHHDEALRGELVDVDGPSPEAVARRADEHDLVVGERLEANGTMTWSGAHDPELEPSLGDQLDDGPGVVHLERDAHPWMSVLELAEELRHDDRGWPGRRADRQRARELALALGDDVVEQLLLEREQPLRATVEAHSRFGRLDATAGAVEELRAEALLERAHLQRDGRLGDTELVGRVGERASLDDRAERRQLPCVHKRILCPIETTSVYFIVLYNGDRAVVYDCA